MYHTGFEGAWPGRLPSVTFPGPVDIVQSALRGRKNAWIGPAYGFRKERGGTDPGSVGNRAPDRNMAVDENVTLAGNTASGRKRIVVLVFFGILLVLGLGIHRDYGVSWDEPFQREYGRAAYAYITRGDESMFEGPNQYYGPAFELALLGCEKAIGLDDSRDIYFMRHLLTHLLFLLGLAFFYKFCVRIFGDWRIGLLGCLLLVVSPRIFAHSFYNPKDIPVMALYMIGMLTLLRLLERMTIWRALLHALVCAILVDIRIVGGMLPAITVASAVGSLIQSRSGRENTVRSSAALGAYLAALAVLVIAFWPTLWRDPVYHFAKAFEEMSHYPLNLPVKYLGEFVWPKDLPWHYTSVWILVTTPVVCTLLFIAGTAASIVYLLREYEVFPLRMRDLLIVLVWFFFPLVYLPLSGAVVFDEWRHVLFVYPAFVSIALVGLVTAIRIVRLKTGAAPRGGSQVGFRGRLGTVLTAALLVALGAGIVNTARIMIEDHPYQNVYFNALAGGIRGAEGRFDLDYWGLSYREALEEILRADRNPSVSVSVYTRPGRSNAGILDEDQRRRIQFLDDPYQATYFATHERWDRLSYRPSEEFFAVRIDGVRIMLVLRETTADSLVTILGE